MADTLTIDSIHDDLLDQLDHGTVAVLWSRNLPSERLWTLVGATLSSDPAAPVTQIVLSPPSSLTSVRVSPVAGDHFTVTGQVDLLNLVVTTTITVTVQDGEPDLAFDLVPPSSWTLGQSFQAFDNRLFDQWCGQLTGTKLTWSSAGKTTSTALVLDASLLYSGIYSVINTFYSGQVTQAFTAAIAFGEFGPTLDTRIPVVHTGDGALTVGPVKVNLPYFASRLTYRPDESDDTLVIAITTIGFGWNIDSQNAAVHDFEILAVITDDYPVLTVSGGYPDDDNALALTDIVEAMYGSVIAPPSLPAPLQFLATDVGLQRFSVSAGLVMPPEFEAAQIYIATKPTSPGWVIIGPASDPLLALQEIHFRYATVASDDLTFSTVALGGTLKIGSLLFMADAAYSWSGADYVIDGRGELVTADGLPLRFSALIAGFGAPSVAAAFDDFLELSFSLIGADLSYESTGGVITTRWSAYANADLKLKFFGQEFLGLHNTTVNVAGVQAGSNPVVYEITASGQIFILGAVLPAQLVLSGETKTFSIGPVSFTLGDIITWMVNIIHPSWNYELPEPWNVLNSIGFENLTLEFDLENQTVTLDTGLKADFGFINLSSVRLTYHKSTPGSAKQGVIFAMKGTFLGLPIEVTTDDPDLEHDELGWDLVNGKPVEVPGAGDALFKLDYLGIGQHVAFRDTHDLHTVGEVITALENNLTPVADDSGNPLAKQDGLVFAENSGWLLGTKFSLLSTVTISAIFNDPQLYGLRIALAGEKAQSLSGLEFEILYKRISDTIGLYHIDLRLPDAIRQLEFGEVSVTIPEFVLDIYTNGNFKIDVGFPYQLDFSRSFSVEVFPFVGFGGLYFGYLEGTTSDRVPTVSDGTFKPVIEFGLGLSIGVGKTIEKGMLRAGATLTVEGLVEGVLGWFNPDDANRDTAQFYSIAGTVGIEGHVYGAIDFKIVKASIDISASARVSLVIECYQPIDIALNVSVSARVSVKVLFITIHCSFSMDISLEYTIGHATTPPWTIDTSNTRQLTGLAQKRHRLEPNEFARLRAKRATRLQRAMRAPKLDLTAVSSSLFLELEAEQSVIALQFRPFFTQSDEPSLANTTAPAAGERARSIALLYTATAGTGPDTVFATLASLCFQRVAAAALAAKPEEKDRISLYDLTVIKKQLDLGLHDPDFSYDALVAFFTAAGIVFDISTGPQTGAISGTFFPMIPALTLTDLLKDSSGQEQQFVSVDYATDPRFMVDETYEAIVDSYFRAFQVSSETLVEQQASGVASGPVPRSGSSESMAQYVFRDYFLMITQSMVQAAIDYLEDYPYTAPAGAAVSLTAVAAANSAENDPYDENPTPLSIALANAALTDILDSVGISATEIAGVRYQANNGESLDDIGARFGVAAVDLAAMINPDFGTANASGPNMVNAGVQIGLGDIVYTCPDDSMNLTLVALLFAVSPDAVQNDPANSGLNFALPFPAGTEVHVPSARYVLQAAETLSSVAANYQTTLSAVVTLNASLKTLVQPLSIWAIPAFAHSYQSGDSLESIAKTYALSLAQLLAGGYAAAPVIKAGATLTIPYRPDIAATDLYAAMGQTAVTGPVANSVSRFMMHGLRLPQISPLTFDAMKPFYDNLGQQIDVPDVLLTGSGYSYSLTLTADPRPGWITFNTGTSTSGSYAYTTEDLVELGLFNASFTPDQLTVRQLGLMAYAPNRYPLRQVIHWQSPHGLTPVTGQDANGNGEPNIWRFPAALLQRLASAPGGTDALAPLKFDIAIGRQPAPNAPPVYTPVESFAWGSMIDITVKRVMAGASGSIDVKNDYLLSGLDNPSRETLYQIWTYMTDPAYSDQADLYVLCRADPASQSGRGVISQDLATASTAILKTNLSTTNNPSPIGMQLNLMEGAGETPVFAASISDPKNFLRLIWESATVNSGGYYLNYTESGTGNGLPDDLFDTNGIATIQLLTIFSSQRHSGDTLASQPAMLRMTNCAVLSDHLDISNGELLVEGANYQVEAGTSLASVQTAMGFPSMAEFVQANQALKVLLRQGLQITAGSGTTVETGDSLVSIAARAGCSALDVATAVASDTTALIPGALCQYAPGQMRLIGTGAVGSVGLEVTRADPDPGDAAYDTLSAQQKLDLMFNLLGVDLEGNSWFQPLAMTADTGQPAGHAKEWPAAGPMQPDDVPPELRAGTWVYRKLVPYYEFAVASTNAALDAPRLPPRLDNPYAGIAQSSAIALDVFFQDNFGNRPVGAGASGTVTLPVGYRDLIQPLSAWPGVATSYLVNKIDPQPGGGVFKAGLEIDAGFRTANYASGGGQTVAQARKRIAADQEKMRQIYYQIIQPDMQVTLTTTLDCAGDVPAFNSLPKSSFVDIVNAALLFFGQQLETAQVTTAGVSGDTLTILSARWLLSDLGAFPKANAAMTLGEFFDLAAAGNQLTLPVTILARAGQSLVNIANSATGAMGAPVSEQQVASLNAGEPLRAGTAVDAPQRILPTDGTPAIGDQSLAELAAVYATTVTSLTNDNATDTTILRPGTTVTFEGVDYVLAAGDTFAGLVTAFEQVAAAPGRDTFRTLAEARGLSVGALAFANESTTAILAENATFTYPNPAGGSVSAQVAAGDSLYTVAYKIAAQLEVAAITVESLATANQDVPGLITSGATLATGLTRVTLDAIANSNSNVASLFTANAQLKSETYRLQPGDTFNSVVAAFSLIDPAYTLDQFVSANRTVGDLLPAGAQLLAGTKATTADPAETLGELASANGLSFTQIGQFNSGKALNVTTLAKYLVPERTTAETLTFSMAQPSVGEGLAGVASRFANMTAAAIAGANGQMWRTLMPGVAVTLNNTSVITTAAMTFDALWAASGGGATIDYAALAAAIDTAAALRPGAVLTGPRAQSGSTAMKPADLAAVWNTGVEDLLTANRAVSGLLAAGAVVTFDGSSGPVTLTVRPNDTINTFQDYAVQTAGLEALDRSAYFSALASAAGLIAAGAAFTVPPMLERISTRINRNFPSKLFRLTQAVSLARVNYKVTPATVTALETIPDITAAQASKLDAMASAATLYIDGDTFDADVREAFGPEPDIDYLIAMTRRFSVLPTVLMDPSFLDVPAAQAVETQIPAHASPNSPVDSAQSLRNFAALFEAAFEGAVKVSVSAAGDAAEPAQAPRQLWAVDFSASGYGFTVHGTEPSFFARQPVLNQLASENAVPMRYYVSGTPTPVLGSPVDVMGADLDVWARQFFETMDLALSPECAVAIHQHMPDVFDSLVAIKGLLAETVSGQLGVLIDNGRTGDLTLARKAFCERLKIQLADAYRIETVLQFPVTVVNGGAERSDLKPPRLFGQPVNMPYVTAAVETIESLAAALHVSSSYAVEMFADMPGILNLGAGNDNPVTVTYIPTGATAQPVAADSLSTLAVKLGITGLRPAQALIGSISIAPAGAGLFAPKVSLSAIEVPYSPGTASTIEAAARVLDVSVPQLAAAMQDTLGLFNPAVTSLTWIYGDNGSTATVPVTSTSTLNTLASAFAAAGVTPAPDAIAVANYFRLLPSDLIAQGATLSIIELIPNTSFNATAVPLSETDSALTFFLEVSNPARARKLFMNIDFPINQIEHDIAAVPADPDYENSAWLSFLLPFDSAGGSVNSRIGMVEIPTPDETYPEPPVLTGQTGVATGLPVPPVTVADFKKWDYSFDFEYRAAAQDQIYTGVTINRVSGAGQTDLLFLREDDAGLPSNILEALAQFNASYAPLTEDLQQLPFLSAESTGNPALASAPVLAEFAAQIQSLWQVLPAVDTIGGEDGDHAYVFTMTRAREQEVYLDTLIMTGQKPGEALWPTRAEVRTSAGVWHQLTLMTPNPDTEVVFAYPQKQILASETLTHRIWFVGLDAIVEQSARAGVHVTRNADLSSEGATLPAFIYQTPVIATVDNYTPLIARADPYVLTAPAAPDNDLTHALSDFFSALFDIGSVNWATGTTRKIIVHVAYRFDLAPGQPLSGSDLTPQAPSVLHTQYEFKLNPASGSPDYEPVSGTFVSNLADAAESWTAANLDAGQPGYLVFDLLVLADSTVNAPNPVLRLTKLLWDLNQTG